MIKSMWLDELDKLAKLAERFIEEGESTFTVSERMTFIQLMLADCLSEVKHD